ncbi:hypothetical protein IKX64_00435 [Candidatus Saccharibacteria bacterium]|nr:hypothetical protein [Candidatus Saccharibacteria bacterium]
MEQEKKPAECSCEKCKCECCKCGKGLKIAVVFTTILALAGAGFGVYGMFFKKDAQPAPVAEPEAKVEESEEYYLGTVSGAQYFLNQMFNLPKAVNINYLSSGDTLTENDKAILIIGAAKSSYVKNVDCQTASYITLEEYGALYKKLFGQEFKYDSNENYTVDKGNFRGKFSDKPGCSCCESSGVENSYYEMDGNLANSARNLIVEKVADGSIYGKAYVLYDGEFDMPNEPQLMGEFEVKYAKNDNGYYITDIDYKRL